MAACFTHTEPQKALRKIRKAVDSAISRQICSDIMFSPSVQIVFQGESMLIYQVLVACRQSLVADIVQSCGLTRATGAVDAALQCIIQMAASAALQVLYSAVS